MSNQVSTSSGGGDKAGLVQRKVEQGINLAKQDAAAVASLGTEALKSTAYLYPMCAFTPGGDSSPRRWSRTKN